MACVEFVFDPGFTPTDIAISPAADLVYLQWSGGIDVFTFPAGLYVETLPKTSGGWEFNNSLTADSDGNLYWSEILSVDQHILKRTPANVRSVIYTETVPNFGALMSLAYNPDDDKIYSVYKQTFSPGNEYFRRFSLAGVKEDLLALPTTASALPPAVTSDGCVWMVMHTTRPRGLRRFDTASSSYLTNATIDPHLGLVPTYADSVLYEDDALNVIKEASSALAITTSTCDDIVDLTNATSASTPDFSTIIYATADGVFRLIPILPPIPGPCSARLDVMRKVVRM